MLVACDADFFISPVVLSWLRLIALRELLHTRLRASPMQGCELFQAPCKQRCTFLLLTALRVDWPNCATARPAYGLSCGPGAVAMHIHAISTRDS
jgi:hypothetical protein